MRAVRYSHINIASSPGTPDMFNAYVLGCLEMRLCILLHCSNNYHVCA